MLNDTSPPSFDSREKLLPVLDNFDLALAHGETGAEAVYRSLMNVLEAEGLEKLDPVGSSINLAQGDPSMTPALVITGWVVVATVAGVLISRRRSVQ